MPRSESRFSASIAVVGFALIALTPTAPAFIRHIDLAFVHLYRVFDAVVGGLRTESKASQQQRERARLAAEETRHRIQAGIKRWNDRLRDGARALAPRSASAVARIVAIDRVKRRLLIDAGLGLDLRPNDVVVASSVLIGRVQSSQQGLAVVETPWTPDARFAAASFKPGAEEPIRFVARGLVRDSAVAAVTNPERREGLTEGGLVETPEVSDLVPEDFGRIPPGFTIGRLAYDREAQRRSAEDQYLIEPIVDLELLDAVVVLYERDRLQQPVTTFAATEARRLGCGLLSPWRDGVVMSGISAPEGSPVLLDETLVGSISHSLVSASRARGMLDPGRSIGVLVIGRKDTFPAEFRVKSHRQNEARLEVARLANGYELSEGDLIVTAGRGAQMPRGLFIGTLHRSADGDFSIEAPEVNPDAKLTVLRRSEYPDDPWGG